MFLAFPATMLVSTVVTGLTGRVRRQGGGVDADRDQYLNYLSDLSRSVSEIAVAHHRSAISRHPDPDTLWTLIGGPRMWGRWPTDADFGLVRGHRNQPLARRGRPAASVGGAPRSGDRHGTQAFPACALDGPRAGHDRPECGDMRDGRRRSGEVRGLLRAILCQLAVLRAPDEVLIAAAVDDENRSHWDWLKWLPHNQHPVDIDGAGPVRMIYPTTAEAQQALAAIQGAEVVVVTDLAFDADPIVGVTTIGVGTSCDGAPLMIRTPADPVPGRCPDRIILDALICARRLAGHHPARPESAEPNWPRLMGLSELDRFDPVAWWRCRRDRDRLCAPIGTTPTAGRWNWTSKSPPNTGWARTGSASAPPGQASRNYCAPSRWA